MSRKIIGFALCALLFALDFSAQAQQPQKVPRIGFLTGASLSATSARIEAFRQGLRELGYVEGKNIVIEWRSWEGKRDALPVLAAELVRLNVEVIVTGGSTNTRAAKQATAMIPIVMAQDPDPVGNGFVASLSRPGGNITGLSSPTADLAGKRLELLKEILPKLARTAVFGTSTNRGNAQQLRKTQRAAGVIGMQLQYLDILGPKDIETAFRAASNGHADAVLVLNSFLSASHREQLADLAAKSRFPATYPHSMYVEAGGLISYGVNSNDLARRAATYIYKILKGAKPADLPVEQPTKFELVINLKTAKALGLKIPAHLLMEANRVIE
ncbi:MAG: ABC transporter substrate-binding protein [Candidatus Binatia bacterium]